MSRAHVCTAAHWNACNRACGAAWLSTSLLSAGAAPASNGRARAPRHSAIARAIGTSKSTAQRAMRFLDAAGPDFAAT
jgi:hypothetical protein